MAWCETNRVDYLFGLARNARLSAAIDAEMADARIEAEATGKAARRFRDFTWSTLDSWARARRVTVAMASACPWQHEWALAHAMLRRAGT